MADGITSLLRIRVVNKSPSYWFTDGFENVSTPTMAPTLWHSLGTEAGTDNSINYWTTIAGSPTYAAHVLTVPAGAQIQGGHADWTDCTATVQFIWQTGGTARLHIHSTDANNYIACEMGPTNIILNKHVAGVSTDVATAAFVPTNGHVYWLQISAVGTTYTATAYVDSSNVPGAVQGTCSGTISDAAVQSGAMGISSVSTSMTYGSAHPNVCYVTGTGPDGTQGQAWTPVVTTGEPAFAWSKVSPYAGTYTASICSHATGGSGSWQQTIRLFSGSNVTLSGRAKKLGATTTISAGGLTTSAAGTSWGLVTATGAMTTNPTVSCNMTAGASDGIAYFDALSITNPAYEITTELPHLHTTSYTVQAMQPGSPSSTALGAFTINLHPPGSEGYAAAKAIYDQLDYYQRVEMYESADGASLGKLVFAGPITGIDNNDSESATFKLTGASDVQWANLSRPFPGELLSLGYGSGSFTNASYRQARNYFGTNEPGWTDTFNSYTSANYTSTNYTSGSTGNWAAGVDAGFNVVTCSTGTDAVLISKVGIRAGDMLNTNFAEVSGRLLPSSDTSNAGGFGIGLSLSSTTVAPATGANNLATQVRAKKNVSTGRWDADVLQVNGHFQTSTTNALTSVDDPEGYIPFTISIQARGSATADNQVSISAVNGNTGFTANTFVVDLGQTTVYPYLYFNAAGSGTATVYMRNLVQEARFSDDRNPGVAAFKSGTIGTPAHSLTVSSDAGPTFLEVWSRAAALEGWYWRYTPQPFVVGTRTLGTVDLTTDPGTDRGTNQSIVFSRDTGNLVSLQLSANADQFASGTTASSISGTDGGGVATWRDISTITKYGVIDDQTLAVTTPTFSEQTRSAQQIVANKINLSALGSKAALVLRDPQTADKWRELDKVMIHNPRQSINYLVARVLALTFDENVPTQSLILDQFGADFIVPVTGRSSANQSAPVHPPLKRLQQAVFQVANKFAHR